MPMSDLQEESDIAWHSQKARQKAVVTDVTDVVVDTVMPSVVSIFGTYSVTENFGGYAIAGRNRKRIRFYRWRKRG